MRSLLTPLDRCRRAIRSRDLHFGELMTIQKHVHRARAHQCSTCACLVIFLAKRPVLVQERQDSSLPQLDTDTSPSSTGLWPSTLQYLLPRLPFGSSQSRPSIVPSPAASSSTSTPAAVAAPDKPPAAQLQAPAADSAAPSSTSSAHGNGFTPFEAIGDDSMDSSSPPGVTAMPFTDPSQNDRSGIGTLDRRPDSPSLSHQESILADSSSRWLEDRDGQSGVGSEEAGSSGREEGEKEETPRMLFFWRSNRSKQPKPEPEIQPLQV